MHGQRYCKELDNEKKEKEKTRRKPEPGAKRQKEKDSKISKFARLRKRDRPEWRQVA